MQDFPEFPIQMSFMSSVLPAKKPVKVLRRMFGLSQQVNGPDGLSHTSAPRNETVR